MDWTTEEFVEWLATDEDASFELPDGMTGNDFLRYWIQLGDDPSSHFVRLSPDEGDDLMQHASFQLNSIIWWQDETGKDVAPELKVAAIAAAPTILEAASRATSGHCMGCLMF